MLNLCKYKDLFGKPNTGMHSYRLFNIAVADVVMTIIGAYIFSWIFKFSFPITLAIFFLSGIIIHRLFCVRTTVDKLVFPNVKE